MSDSSSSSSGWVVIAAGSVAGLEPLIALA